MNTALRILAASLLLLLASCGFQLRGAYVMPFNALHMDLPETGELHALIRRQIEAASAAKVVSDVKQSDARLQVLSNLQTKNVLSTNAAGRVREYELVQQFRFKLIDKQDQELIAPVQITVRRDITFSDDQVLAKATEESLLWRDMQQDLVQQLLRRLSAVKAKPG